MIVHHDTQDGEAIVILACNDSSIKVVADNGRLQYQAILDSSPTCLATVEQTTGGDETAGGAAATSNSSSALVVLYGLQNGNIGAIELGVDEAIVLWEL